MSTPKLITEQKDIADASNADLVYSYNKLTGKDIKKFSSRGAGEAQMANAILASKSASGKAGVAKGEEPKAKPAAEQKSFSERAKEASKGIAAKAIKRKTVEQRKAEADAALAAKKTAAPAKKAAAKKTAAPAAPKAKATPRPRTSTYNRIKFRQPSSLRRPNPDSMRTKVLQALEKRGEATVEQLSKDVGFNARSYVHKLVFQEWAEIMPNVAAEA